MPKVVVVVAVQIKLVTVGWLRGRQLVAVIVIPDYSYVAMVVIVAVVMSRRVN